MDTLKKIINKLGGSFRGLDPIEIIGYGRNKMATLFGELGFQYGAEIGVCDGTYSQILCEAITDVQLFGVDPYDSYKEYTDFKLKSTFQRLEKEAKERLDCYDYHFIKKYSMDAVREFKDEGLDFVYIDANHEYPFVLEDITEWTKKVKLGGIVAGHDYDRVPRSKLRENWGVSDAVGKYVKEHNISPLFLLGDNKRGGTNDPSRTWMFIKS